MAIVDFPGEGVFTPPMLGFTVNPSLSTALSISGANASDKLAQIGRAAFAARTGSKTITKVHFLFGTVVKAAGSTLRVSLQDVDTVNGPVIRPDGTVDQSVTIANADTGFATGSWYTATLGSSRTVTYGSLLAVVFDWGSAQSGDSVVIAGYTVSSASSNGGAIGHQNICVQFTSSAWGIISMIPNVILEFDDGSFGTLGGALPTSAVGTIAANTGTTPDENALEFQLPYNCEVDGAWVLVNPSAGGDFDVVLYSGTTALATVSIDSNSVQASAARFLRVSFDKVALTADTTYRLAIKPTTVNTVTLYYRDVSAAGHRAVTHLGTTARLNSRTDAGAWGAGTDTRIIFAGVRISGIDIDPPDIDYIQGARGFVA